MFKSKYSITLTLVAICLCALIIVQVIWMRDALLLKNEQFHHKAQSALNQLALDFDDDIFCSELFTNIKFNAGDGMQFFQNEWTEDSLGNKVWNEGSGGQALGFYYKGENEELISYKDLKFNYPATVQVYLKINTGFDTSKAKVFDQRELSELDLGEMPKPKDFKNFVKAHQNPLLIFNNAYVDSILGFHLFEQGLALDFEYAIFDSSHQVVYAPDGQGNIADKNVYSQEVKLLDNNNFFDPYWLRIRFPEKNYFIFKGSVLFLIISIVIILALIASFYVFVRFLLRQVQLNQMKSNFVNNMTHEFKTPTANISLAIENMEIIGEPVFTPKVKKYLRIINEENKRMITNVERILEVAKYSDTKNAKLKFEAVNVKEVILEVSERIKLRVVKVKGSFKCTYNTQKFNIKGDRHHIKNTLSNLLDNAIKYSDESPVIDLVASSDGNFLCIEIIDEGIGIDKPDLDRIFEAFYRKDTGNVHNVKGFGIGLSYVKRVAEMHQGTIEVKSKLGQGAVFTLRLPLDLDNN